MSKKRKSSRKILSSSSSSESEDAVNPSLQIAAIPYFNVHDSEWEERVKKLRPGTDSSSDFSVYMKPDLHGDVQKILNKSYSPRDFVKKQRLSLPTEKPRLSEKERKSASKSSHKDAATTVTLNRAESTKIKLPEKAKYRTKKPEILSSTTSSVASTFGKFRASAEENVFHSTPINPRKAMTLTDPCKMTPIAPKSGTQVFSVPRLAVKKVSHEKNADIPVSASMLEATDQGREFSWVRLGGLEATECEFKRTSIKKWIDEAKKSQPLWSPVSERNKNNSNVEQNSNSKVFTSNAQVEKSITFGHQIPQNELSAVMSILNQHSQEQEHHSNTVKYNEATSNNNNTAKQTTDIPKDSTYTEWNSSCVHEKSLTFSEQQKSTSKYKQKENSGTQQETPKYVNKFESSRKSLSKNKEKSISLVPSDPSRLKFENRNDSSITNLNKKHGKHTEEELLELLSQPKSVNRNKPNRKSLDNKQLKQGKSKDLNMSEEKSPSPKRARKSIIGGTSRSNSTVNISDVNNIHLETGNKVGTSGTTCEEPTPKTTKKEMSKDEYLKRLSEALKRRGVPERIVSTNTNMIDKEKLKRCALIWGNTQLSQDELEFMHKKFNDEALKLVNGLYANSTYPGGVFTYQEFKAALVNEGLIENIAAEPHRTMFQTWTTKEQKEAKRIGLMRLSKSDDPNLLKFKFLYPDDK